MAVGRFDRRQSAGRKAAVRFAAIAIAAAIVATGLAATATAQDRYTDVTSTSHRSHKANIDALDSSGVFDGTECGARRFCPDRPANRWTVAVWIVRVIDGTDPVLVDESRFADVDNNEWWMPYVERLADLGVTAGCKTDPVRFCPYETVTRARMASFLVSAFRLQRAESANFTDTRGSVHEANIDALYASGLTAGCNERPLRYCPRKPVTRAQMATLLNSGLNASTSVGTGGTTGPTGRPVAGTITNSQGPRSGDTEIKAVRGRSCAVRSDETVTCWGGDDGYREHLSASGLNDVVAMSISDHPTDALHACAVHDNGDVSCWGAGSEGQLGQGSLSTYYLPVRVLDIRDAVGVASGAGFACAVHRNGDVSCWGANEQGQLGDGTTLTGRYWPQRISRFFDAVAISSGKDHTCAIHDDGALSCWGWVYGTRPSRVSVPGDVTSVSMGGVETCITITDGRVYCWDYLGNTASPMAQVAGISDAVKVSVGNDSACVLHLRGGVSCWGRNDVGQVGDGSTTRRHTPVQVGSINDAVDISVSSGSTTVGAHACALHFDGSVSCWGGNEAGQLEDGTLTNGLTPREVELLNRIHRSDVPRNEDALLLEWIDKIVSNWGREFPWLWDAWDHIDLTTTASDFGSGGDVTVDCTGGASYGCDVSSMIITDMTMDTVVRQLARVYDLQAGLASAAEWGAVQLYFASTYPRCAPGDYLHGAEVLADTLLHVTVPYAYLPYYEGRTCSGLPRTPTPEAERLVEQGLEGRRMPDWYFREIVNASDLWTTWLRGTSLPALDNLLSGEYGGLCDINWIATWIGPLVDTTAIPAQHPPPFRQATTC